MKQTWVKCLHCLVNSHDPLFPQNLFWAFNICEHLKTPAFDEKCTELPNVEQKQCNTYIMIILCLYYTAQISFLPTPHSTDLAKKSPLPHKYSHKYCHKCWQKMLLIPFKKIYFVTYKTPICSQSLICLVLKIGGGVTKSSNIKICVGLIGVVTSPELSRCQHRIQASWYQVIARATRAKSDKFHTFSSWRMLHVLVAMDIV